jgi:hypothetical protein
LKDRSKPAMRDLAKIAYRNPVNEAAERLVQNAQDSCRRVVDHAVGLQERNVLLAERLVEDSIRHLHHQSERNWDMAQELFEQAEEQSDLFRKLVEESVDAYIDFLYLPFSRYSKV